MVTTEFVQVMECKRVSLTSAFNERSRLLFGEGDIGYFGGGGGIWGSIDIQIF